MPAQIPGKYAILAYQRSNLRIEHVVIQRHSVDQHHKRAVCWPGQPEVQLATIAFKHIDYSNPQHLVPTALGERVRYHRAQPSLHSR
jgi:hypothetical protein